MPKKVQLNDKDEVYILKLTEWQRSALHEVISIGNYKGSDIKGLAKLMEKIENLTPEEPEEPEKQDK